MPADIIGSEVLEEAGEDGPSAPSASSPARSSASC